MKICNIYILFSIIKFLRTLGEKGFSFNLEKNALIPKKLLRKIKAIEKLDYNDKDHNETFLILTEFLLKDEPSNVETLNKIKANKAEHKKTLVILKKILMPNYFTDEDIQELLGSKSGDITQDDILFYLGEFLISAGNKKIDKPQLKNFQKKLKLLSNLLSSKELEDIYAKELLNSVYITKQDKLKILGEFLVVGRSTEIGELEMLDDKNYQNRLNILGDLILSEDLNNIHEKYEYGYQEKYKEMLEEFKEFLATNEGEVLSVEKVNKEALEFLKGLFLSDKLTKIEYISKLNLESEKHLEILVLLSEFLLFGGLKNAQGKVIRTNVVNPDAMMGDTPITVGHTDNLTQSGSEELNMQKRDSQPSGISSNVQLQDDLVLLDISQKDKLKLLGEFLIKEIDAEYNDDALESFLEKNKEYKNRLKFIREFILSKNLTEKNEYKRMCSEKKYKKMLNQLENSEPFIKLLKVHSGDVLDLKNAYQDVLASLKKFLLPGAEANLKNLEALSCKSNEHREVLVLLGNFLLFDEPASIEAHKNNKSSPSLKVFNEEGTMQGDSPLINRKAGVSSARDSEGKKADDGEPFSLEKGKHLRLMKSGSPKPNKLRNVNKKAQNRKIGNLMANKPDLGVDKAVNDPIKSKSRSENLVIVKNEKDLNSATVEKPKTYDKEKFGDSSLNNIANDHLGSNSDELENQKGYKQAIITNDPKRNNHFRIADSVNRKHVDSGETRASKSRDIEGKPQNASQRREFNNVVRKLQNEEVQYPITLTFTTTRSNK